jgi:hypothetical protein
MNPAHDPFADTVLEYAYDLVVRGVLAIPDHVYGHSNSRSLIRMLLERELRPAQKLSLGRKGDDDIDKAVAQALAICAAVGKDDSAAVDFHHPP